VTIEMVADRHELRLDGRTPKTPRGAPLSLPTEPLAELVAAEWRAQGELIAFAEMPATRLAHTALDAISAARAQTALALERYAAADLLCYLAEGPESLVRRQIAAWAPILDWAREELDLEFIQTTGIVHRPQPAATLVKVTALAGEMDDFTLAGTAFAASVMASAVLALALAHGRLDGPAALSASRIEETFQEERWGVDAEAAARTQLLLKDAVMLEHWFAALR
jgi:chaperone required for assembly of F1-ATPase